MNGLGYVLVGLTAGWLIEWLFDYFFWRKNFELVEKAKNAAEEKLKSTENVLFLIRQDLSDAEGELKEYQRKLLKSEQEIAALKAPKGEIPVTLDAATGSAPVLPHESQMKPATGTSKEAALFPHSDLDLTVMRETMATLAPEQKEKAGQWIFQTLRKVQDASFTAIQKCIILFKNYWKIILSWFRKKPSASRQPGIISQNPEEKSGRQTPDT